MSQWLWQQRVEPAREDIDQHGLATRGRGGSARVNKVGLKPGKPPSLTPMRETAPQIPDAGADHQPVREETNATEIDIIQKQAHQSAQEVAMKSYLQTYIEEYRRVFEDEVDRLYRQWKEEKQGKEDAETRSEA